MPSPDQLTLDDDAAFQRREWFVQRLGWIAIALLLFAALLGLTGGPGPLSTTTLSSPDGKLSLACHRFERRHRDTQWTITARPAARDHTCTLSLSQPFLASLNLKSITPTPDHVETAGNAQLYTFRITDASAPLVVTLAGEAESMGNNPGELRMEASALSFSQFVFP